MSKSNEIKYETCVRCGAKTDVPTQTPVEYREDYIYGVGQLCETCSRKMLEGTIEGGWFVF